MKLHFLVNKHFYCRLNHKTLTNVDYFQGQKEVVVKCKIFKGTFGAVVLDEGKATCSKYVVVGALHFPIKMRKTKLVVLN